ncbi:MADS-box protein SOC1 [Vitis vinifera]|uniref:MADS-box protein SOC1 n=1 Tax=Vitis vinifera TaxID=29760 RepID=A0A438IWK7_VITVI|nr:MADS-box protein SOC1 [Vitis vinifera]
MQETIERYQRHTKDVHTNNYKTTEHNMQLCGQEDFTFPFFSAAFLATMEPYEQIFLDFLMNSIGLKSQHLKHEAANMAKKIELLEISKRKLLGEGLGSCSIEELQQIEQQLERSVSSIRARKNQVFKEQIEQLKEKEKALAAENAMLCEKCGVQPYQAPNQENETLPSAERSQNSDVSTDLFIGLPEGRAKRLLLGN